MWGLIVKYPKYLKNLNCSIITKIFKKILGQFNIFGNILFIQNFNYYLRKNIFYNSSINISGRLLKFNKMIYIKGYQKVEIFHNRYKNLTFDDSIWLKYFYIVTCEFNQLYNKVTRYLGYKLKKHTNWGTKRIFQSKLN